MRRFTVERRVVQQLLTGVFWELWFACKGMGDSTGAQPQEQNVQV